jgi:hypothetical protein
MEPEFQSTIEPKSMQSGQIIPQSTAYQCNLFRVRQNPPRWL